MSEPHQFESGSRIVPKLTPVDDILYIRNLIILEGKIINIQELLFVDLLSDAIF